MYQYWLFNCRINKPLHRPRMCIGRRFATLECYVLVIALLQRFSLEYHHAPVGLATVWIFRPDKPIKLRLLPR